MSNNDTNVTWGKNHSDQIRRGGSSGSGEGFFFYKRPYTNRQRNEVIISVIQLRRSWFVFLSVLRQRFKRY